MAVKGENEATCLVIIPVATVLGRGKLAAKVGRGAQRDLLQDQDHCSIVLRLHQLLGILRPLSPLIPSADPCRCRPGSRILGCCHFIISFVPTYYLQLSGSHDFLEGTR